MAIIPQSFYETYLTSAVSAAATTIPVATCPATGVTTGFITIGTEIIKFEGNSNPGGAGNLTSCTRGLALSGTTETTAGLGVAHAAGVSVKIADVHYYMNNAAAALALTTTGTITADDYAQFTATGIIQGRSYSEARTDLGLVIGTNVLAEQSIGITNDYLLEVDGSPNDGEVAVFTAAGINGLTEAEFKTAYNMEAGTDFAAINQTFYVGTTQIAINRASAALTLAGLTLTTPDIGTPSGGTLTSCTGLPAAGVVNTAATLTDTQTLTNKRITPRVWTAASDATPDIDTDLYDAVTITALAAAITDVNMEQDSPVPVNFQKIIFRIKDNGTARAITWGDDFEDAGVALPTTTVISKLLTVGFIFNTVTNNWGCVAVANET